MTGALLWAWGTLKESHEAFAVLASFVGIIVASIVAAAALKQARTASRQAQIARERHEAQTEADLQRRITENYIKAVEQLGSDKLQVRIGGIYALERISQESPRDYWTVMETLTAFVRERARWKELDDTDLSQTEAPVHTDEPQRRSRHEPPTDIKAVLTVIMRRSEANREREKREGWRLDLGSIDLRGAILAEAHLEGANLRRAHLEGANLRRARLEGAILTEAHLDKDAILAEAHLEGAFLVRAHLEGADFSEAHFESAIFYKAHREGAKGLQGLPPAAMKDGNDARSATLGTDHRPASLP